MSLEVIYVVRHGFRSSWNVDHVTGQYSMSIRSPTGIPNDPPLTSHGIDQSHELASHLMNVYPPIDQVYSSPYYRCIQTIQPFVELQNQQQGSNGGRPSDIRAEGGISEWFGAAHFEHPMYAPMGVLGELFPSLDTTYESALTRPAKGESAVVLHKRAAEAMQAIIERSDREGKKAIVLCSHAATVIALGRVLTGRVPTDLEEDDFRAFTCGLSVYRRQNPDTTPLQNNAIGNAVADQDWRNTLAIRGGWECEANSDCSFLKNGPERGWRFSVEESFVDFGTPEVAVQAADARDKSAGDASKL